MLLSGFYCAHFIEIRGNGNSYRFKKTIAPLLLFHLQNAKNAQRKIRYEPEIALGVIVFVCYNVFIISLPFLKLNVTLSSWYTVTWAIMAFHR